MNLTRVSVVFLVLKLVFCCDGVSDGSDSSDSYGGISSSSARSGGKSSGSSSDSYGGISSSSSRSGNSGSSSDSYGGISSSSSARSDGKSSGSSDSSGSSGSYPETNSYSHYNVHHTNMYPFGGYTPTLGMACKTCPAVNNRGNRKNIIKEVTIINENNSILYESMLPRRSEINLYKNRQRFSTVRKNVGELIKCRIVVGHNLKECLKLLNIYHPKYLLRDTTYFCKNNSNIPQDKDSFKNIAREFLHVEIGDHNTSAEHAMTAIRVYKTFQREWEIHVSKENKPAFALDCEMVECVWPNKTRVENVVRISIVDHKEEVIYDKIIKPELPVSHYRTFITGLRPEDFARAENFAAARERIRLLLKGQIVVGHAVHHDLSLLGIEHPVALYRDTSLFVRFRRFFAPKIRPSLKELARHYLNMTIQERIHDSVQDALTCMLLYLKFRIEWDEDALKRMDSGDNANDTQPLI